MEFYTETDAASPAKELLRSFSRLKHLLESVITEQGLPIRFNDCGFRLIALAEDNTMPYPVQILHGELPTGEMRRKALWLTYSQLEAGYAIALRLGTKGETDVKAKAVASGFPTRKGVRKLKYRFRTVKRDLPNK